MVVVWLPVMVMVVAASMSGVFSANSVVVAAGGVDEHEVVVADVEAGEGVVAVGVGGGAGDAVAFGGAHDGDPDPGGAGRWWWRR